MEREVFDLDVLFVGAGPASLASAYHLHNKLKSKGIKLCNAVGLNTIVVAEHTMSLILSFSRYLHIARDNQNKIEKTSRANQEKIKRQSREI